MIRSRSVFLLAVLLLLGLPSGAFADSLNVRPVTVGPPSDGTETTLQEFFDNQTGSAIDVLSDQLAFAIFQPTSNNISTVTLRLEEASFESTFGIYKFGDSSVQIPVLGAIAEPGAPGHFSNIIFNAGGITDRVTVKRFNSAGNLIGTTTVDGFGSNVGFYLSHGILANKQTFFSEDSLNENQNAHFLNYAGNGIDNGVIFMAFEDSFDFGNDMDYNDFVVGAESLNGLLPPQVIPEPSSILLLGAGALAVFRRKRSVR